MGVGTFLASYLQEPRAPRSSAPTSNWRAPRLLLLEKAIFELGYEANARPSGSTSRRGVLDILGT